MTLFTASKKSFSVAIFRRARMANIPASVQTLLISAPVQQRKENGLITGAQKTDWQTSKTSTYQYCLDTVGPAVQT